MKRKYLVTTCACITLLLGIALASTGGAEMEPRSDECPLISIYRERGGSCRRPKYRFTANISGGYWDRKPTYRWSISAGKITSGQGMGSIKVDARKADDKPLTVTVEVGNVIPKGCPDPTIESITVECDKQ